MGSREVWLVSAMLVALTIYISSAPADANDATKRIAQTAVERYVALFRCAPLPTDKVTVRNIGTEGGVTQLRVTFPTPLPSGIAENDAVHAWIYAPYIAQLTPSPAVIILHVFGSRNANIERKLAIALARAGIVTAVMELPYHIHRAPKGKRSGEFFWGADMQTLLRSLQQAIMDARRLIDWLTIQPYVDDKRLGVIGVSLGGFIGNVLVGVDERISTCVSILAGGDPAMLVWKSWLTRSWQRSLIRQGITLKALRAQVRWLDPITYAKRVRHRNLLMVIADYDVFAPSETCWKLWHAWGRPPVIRLRTGHLCTLLSISALRRAVVQFAKLTLIDGLDAQSAFKKLPRVPSFAIKTEMLVIIGGKFGPGVAIELTDLDHARRTSLDLHAGLAGIYVGIQWEASRNLAIGLNIRLDGKRIIRPHISAFFIF